MSSIKEPVNIKDLMEEGVVINMNTEEVTEDDPEEDEEYKKNLESFMNMQLSGGLQDEDTYICGQPFEELAAKMEDLISDGGIKKRIIRDGYGNKPQNKDLVRVDYNAYIEFNLEPFDSTYARKRPQQFIINQGDVIPGLDAAVQSMRLNEKAQFILKPRYAYGHIGCLQRVPANSDVLFEVELKEIVDVSAANQFETLPEDDKRQFKNVYEYCLALCAKAKDIYNKNIKGAIKEYNTAAAKLEMCQLNNYEEQEKQQELLLKLYSNLLVAYTRVNEPKKGCVNYNKIFELVKGTNIKINAKMYFNNSRCLRMLGEFDLAKKRLEMAHKLEPNNPEILNELIALDKDIAEYKKANLKMAKALVKSS